MLKNYFKVAFRALWKNKEFSFINIAGLAVGISACVLISLYVLDEWKYDRFHTRANRIYRLTPILHMPKQDRLRAVTSPPMAPALKDNFPEVEKTVRLSPSSRTLSYGDKRIYDTRIWYADSTLFDIFSFPLLSGSEKQALVNPYSIVLTELAAKKYFGDDPPLGKTMALSDTITLTVTGVMKTIPANSHLQFDVVLSRTTITEMNNHEPETEWFNNGTYTYILLHPGVDPKELELKFPAFLEKAMVEARKESGLWYDFLLQPITDIHLKSNMQAEIGPNGNITYVYTFSVVAIMVLLIACANYINLSTAKALNRAKELGMRKVVGAMRKQLIFQLLGESFVVTLLSSVIAVALIGTALPYFNLLTGKSLQLGHLLEPSFLMSCLILFVVISVLAGFYPAWQMSAFSPIRNLFNARRSNQSALMRKGLVLFQFSVSIILIAGSILIYRQMDFMQTRNLGLNKDMMVALRMNRSIVPKYALIKDEIVRTPGIIAATSTDFTYRDSPSNVAVLPDGAQDDEVTSEPVISVDYDFLKTFQIEIVAGRDFSKEYTTDEAEAFIVNETAVRHFDWGTPEQALGKKLDWGLGKKGKVVGVVKDFNFKSLHEDIRPLIMHLLPEWYNITVVKISGQDIPGTLERLEATWKKMNLDSPFDYTFLDQDFANLYKAEQQTQTVMSLLSALAIFIACLGLFGLAAFTAEQRTKEIGIRKVLGANVTGIILLLSRDFMKLVALAIVLAVPIAFVAATRWLDGFAYKTEMSWWIFGAAGGAAISIALATVSFQSIKAAITNPVNSLRNE